MLDAVYVEARQTNSIVAIRLKPPFRPIFQVAAAREGSAMFLVETGESRTQDMATGTISKNAPHISCPYISRVLGSGFPEVRDPVKLESDPLNLIPQLLDQIIALGQTAQQLRHALSGNSPRPERLPEIAKQLVEGGEHAP